jgi:hypothetical protein
MGLERGLLSLVSTTEELLHREVVSTVYKTENTAVGIRHADHVAPSIRKSWQSLRRQARGLRSWGFFIIKLGLVVTYELWLLYFLIARCYLQVTSIAAIQGVNMVANSISTIETLRYLIGFVTECV